MPIAYFFTTFFATFIFLPVYSQRDCACKDPNSSAFWGAFEESGNCVGVCDLAVQRVRRSCYTNDVSNSVQVCDFELPCILHSTCQGHWSTWANVGPCSTPFRDGNQTISRSCCLFEKNGEQTNVCTVNRFCLGGRGLWRQNKTIACSNRQRCPITSTTRTRTKLALTPTSPSTAIPAAAPMTIATTEETAILSTTIKARSIDGTILGAVLGSTGFVCVAAVFTVALLKKRNIESSGSSDMTRTSALIFQASGAYETVGPALPSMRNTKTSIARSEHHPHFAHYAENIIAKGKSVAHEESAYLQPIRPLGTLPMDEDNYVKLSMDAT